MLDDPIPLYDGEPSGAEIRIEPSGMDRSVAPSASGRADLAHSRRKSARRECERIHVYFSPESPDGRVEYVECPVFNVSKGGMALEFDGALPSGTACEVHYRTVSQHPVRVNGRIRSCRLLGEGRFRIGIQFTRQLQFEELKPAAQRAGRDVAPGLRGRPLRPTDAARSDP